MRLRSLVTAVAVGIGVVGGTAFAAQTVASIVGADGTIHGCYAQRTGALRVVAEGATCNARELPIQWNRQGPTGETGPPGPALASLAGVPCDTGSLDKPNGRTEVTVAESGAMTFTCRSSSTNAVLAVALVAGPERCTDVLGVHVCTNVRFSVREVDANGNAVAGGFECQDPHSLSPFPFTCQTQRFAARAPVRLQAFGAPAGFAPSWTGCDSVNGAICTLTPASARTALLTPVAG